jgi:hypothetical protein
VLLDRGSQNIDRSRKDLVPLAYRLVEVLLIEASFPNTKEVDYGVKKLLSSPVGSYQLVVDPLKVEKDLVVWGLEQSVGQPLPNPLKLDL